MSIIGLSTSQKDAIIDFTPSIWLDILPVISRRKTTWRDDCDDVLSDGIVSIFYDM